MSTSHLADFSKTREASGASAFRPMAITVVLLLFCVISFPLFAQQTQVSSTQTKAAAVLKFENREITVFRGELAGTSPQDRVATALERLNGLSGMSLYDQVHPEKIPDGYVIFVGKNNIFPITKWDLLPSQNLDAEAAATAKRLQDALHSRAQDRSPKFVAIGAAYAILGTIVAIIIAVLILRSKRKLLSALVGRVEKGGHLEFFGFDLHNVFLAIARGFVRLISFSVLVLLLYIWITFVLNRFAYTRPWGLQARGLFLDTAGMLGVKFLRAVPNLVTLLIIFVVSRFFIRIIKDFFRTVEAGTAKVPGLYPETASATRRLIVAIIWLFTLIIAYPYIPGSQSDAFKGVSVFVGILFTLGSAGVVGHMMSGLVLVYSRAMKNGDFVKIGEVEGTVIEVGPLSTKIANRRKEEFTIPNTVIVSSTVKNYTRLSQDTGVIVSTSVTIGYDAPWRQVHEMLKAAADRTEGLEKDPPPFVLQTALSDFYVEYMLGVYLRKPELKTVIMSSLHGNIQDVFNEHGVQIMSPHFEDQPEKPVVVPKSKWLYKPEPETSAPKK